MDRLTELFASKPTSYMGLGVVYNGDTRGNGVTSQEQDVVVIPRFNQNDGGGVFKGAWSPSTVDSTHIDLTAGSVTDGVTTFTPTVTNISVHATSLNYVYLECSITPSTDNGFVVGGVITAASITSYTTTKTNTNSKAYLLLATWQASALVARYQWYSQALQILDDGNNTGTAVSHFFPS